MLINGRMSARMNGRINGLMAVVLIAGVMAVGMGAAPDQSGWVSLFDGKTIAHWRGFKQTGPVPGWEVVDGAITWTGVDG